MGGTPGSTAALAAALGGRRALLVAATPREAEAVLRGRGIARAPAPSWSILEVDGSVDLVVCGVGKASAAGACARTLDTARHGAAISIGLCGSLPGSGLEPRAVVAATEAIFADEGLETEEAFLDVAAMGFPPVDGIGTALPADRTLVEALGSLADVRGPIATVSICAGTDRRAQDVAMRTGSVAEAMEGAAIALCALRLGTRFGELRVVSNTTGARARQRWDLAGSLERLSEVAARL